MSASAPPELAYLLGDLRVMAEGRCDHRRQGFLGPLSPGSIFSQQILPDPFRCAAHDAGDQCKLLIVHPGTSSLLLQVFRGPGMMNKATWSGQSRRCENMNRCLKLRAGKGGGSVRLWVVATTKPVSGCAGHSRVIGRFPAPWFPLGAAP